MSPSSVLPLDASHAALIVVPTVAHPQTLIPTIARIAADAETRAAAGQAPIALVLAVNTPDPQAADEALHACRGIVGDANMRHPGCLDLEVWREDRPIGFGAANNRGLMHAISRWGGVPELTVFHNDDAHVPAGWIERLLGALRTQTVTGYSEPWDAQDPHSVRPSHPIAEYGRVGMVGPISNLVAGIQQATAVATPTGTVQWDGRVEPFDAACQARYAGQRVTADFLSGFCVGLGRECLSELMLARLACEDGKLSNLGPVSDFLFLDAFDPTTGRWSMHSTPPVTLELVGPWDEDQYPIAGYEDNDLCVRAELASWRCVVAADTFVGHVGHQTFDRLFPEAQRGMRNRGRYYRRWEGLTSPARDLRMVAVYRLRFEVGNDVHMMRASITRTAQVADGIAVLLTDNPLAVRNDVRWPSEEQQLMPADVAMLQACSGLDAAGVAAVVQAWAEQIAVNATGSRILPGDVRVDVWDRAFNERDERNHTHAMAEGMGADWVLSVDHDELVENRVQRRHFDRLMRHPDPLVRSFDQAWLNHWDSARLVREDHPWGDGGRYVGGMHGFRLWRLPRREDGTLAQPRRIMAGTANGLHCGNSPDHDVTAKRTSAIRFRHLGYVRVQDRHRKRARYREQDPDATADRNLTGSRTADPYGHLINEEGMRLSPYSPINGIGLHVLVHRGETTDDLARVLDWVAPAVDRVVLVWTDAWDAADQGWLAPGKPEVLASVAEMDARHQAWEAAGGAGSPMPEPPRLRCAVPAGTVPTADPATGPTAEMAEMAARFGCEWLHQPLNDDLAAARNAGIAALGADGQGLGWAMFIDLDEHLSNPFADTVAIRRAAECTDAHGWLWTFRNHHRGQQPSRSESVRMARLVPEMYLSGRVHETYDAALQSIQARGQEVTIRPAPFLVEHIGLDKDDAGMEAKLRRYQRLLLLELADNPHNSQAWVSLALHEFNDGRDATGRECLERAVACAGNAYLGYRELGFYHLRIGKALLAGALERTSPHHEFYRTFAPFLKALHQHVPELPILGSAQRGVAVCPPIELPPFPMPPDPAT